MDLKTVVNLQLIMFTLCLCGYVLTKAGVVTPERRKGLSDLLIGLILPCNIICSFMIELKREILTDAVFVLGIALAVQVMSYVMGLFLYRGQPMGRQKVLRYATMCSNAGFMGNPVVEGIYGAQGLLYASVYLIPLRIFMWSAGLSCFTVASPRDIFKKLLRHPCIIAVFIGFGVMAAPSVLPAFLTESLQYLSRCTLPVSMIVIGSILAEVDARKILNLGTCYYCFIRLLVIPAVTLLICKMCGAGGLVMGVCAVLAGMPAGSTTAILAEKYDGDAGYASECVFVSTLLSLFSIPLVYYMAEIL